MRIFSAWPGPVSPDSRCGGGEYIPPWIMRLPRRSRAGRSAALLLVISCGGGGGGTEPPVTPPATVLFLATQPAGAVSGTPLVTQPVVNVLTASGATATTSSATVTVTLSGSPNGVLSGSTSVAAVGGIARFTNLAVSGVGTYVLAFTSPGLTGASSLSFGVAPLLGPPASLAFEPERTILQVGQGLALTAMVRDAQGNLLTTPPLAFVARDPAVATIDDRGLVTTVARGQAIVVARTVAAPTLSDSMLVISAPPNGTVLLSSLSSFAIRRDTTVTLSIYVDMRSTFKRLASGLVDVTFNPAQMTYQSFTPSAGFAPSVGDGEAATGRLRISFADAAGTGGLAEIVRLTFRTASTAGISGRFTLSTSEVTASDYTDLLANMVQVSQPLVLR
jgi:hypothetical protein